MFFNWLNELYWRIHVCLLCSLCSYDLHNFKLPFPYIRYCYVLASFARFQPEKKTWVVEEHDARVRFVFIRGFLPFLQIASKDNERVILSHSLLSTYPITAVFQHPRIVFATRMEPSKPAEKFCLTFVDKSSVVMTQNGFAVACKILKQFIGCKDLDDIKREKATSHKTERERGALAHGKASVSISAPQDQTMTNSVSANNQRTSTSNQAGVSEIFSTSASDPAFSTAKIKAATFSAHENRVRSGNNGQPSICADHDSISRLMKKMQVEPGFKAYVDAVSEFLNREK